MDSISPAWLLLGVLVCSLIGRFMLIRAAWEISKPWGLSVLFVPFAPMVFRMKYKELAGEGKSWNIATTFFAVAFFAVTGSTGSADQLWELVPEKWRPNRVAEHQETSDPTFPETSTEAEEPEEIDSEAAPAAVAHNAMPATPVAPVKSAPAADAAKPGFMGRIAAMVRRPSAAPAKAATLASAQATPIETATLKPLPKPVVPLPERIAANQREFARLGEVYETLKKERGYLRKGDTEGVAAYNAGAANYQAALAAARAEQTEIMKLATVAKK